MKDFSASDTLLTALPVLLVLLALVGAIIFFPSNSVFDIRGKAAPVVIAPISVPLPIVTPPSTGRPETACSELYSPVCSQVDRKTYANGCEAGLAKALPVTPGECTETTL